MQKNVFLGRLAASPRLVGEGEKAVCNFTLIASHYVGSNEAGAVMRPVHIRFVAFRGKAEAIGKKALAGDQMAVDYIIENDIYMKGLEEVHGYSFIVKEFEFGAEGKEKKALRQQLHDAAGE